MVIVEFGIDSREVIDLNNLLMARLLHNAELLLDYTNIQDHNVESSKFSLGPLDKSLDGLIRAHLKLPKLDPGCWKLRAEFGGSVIAFLE